VDLVLADGRVVRASATEHPDLFWAVRGGGGNFGIASSFEFQLHPVGPMVHGGLVVWTLDAAREVLRFYRQHTTSLDDNSFLLSAMLTAPDKVTKVVAILAGYVGPEAGAEAVLGPIKRFGTPVMDQMGPIPYTALNGLLDADFPKGALNYWKSRFMARLDDQAIDALVDRMPSCPSPMSAIVLEHFHGATTRVPTDATAYALRAPGFNGLVTGQWLEPGGSAANIRWVKDTYAILEKHGSERRYTNYLADDDLTEAGLVAAYGPNLPRLRQVKRTYDPENFFAENLNITS
jgi:FAD/FMN-containing dehydrogenase